MEEEIVSKLDFKAQIEFQRTDIRDKAFSGGPERDGSMPGVQRVGLIWRPGQGPWTRDMHSSTGLPLLSVVAIFKSE